MPDDLARTADPGEEKDKPIVTTSLEHLNGCPAAEFVRIVGPVFEHSPWIAAAAAEWRPFASRETLRAALWGVVKGAGEERQLALIRAHPDLVSRAVLTPESSREQQASGLMELTPGEMATFIRLNSQYEARFGFPFVICARKNKKEAILRAFPERLKNSRDVEITTALEQISEIAALRLEDLLP